ncbi:MAG: hypothetical protein WAM14_27055 [Candidatus Nitrosopolaris sp.]
MLSTTREKRKLREDVVWFSSGGSQCQEREMIEKGNLELMLLQSRLNFPYTKVFDIHIVNVIPPEYCNWTSPCYYLRIRGTAVRISFTPAPLSVY